MIAAGARIRRCTVSANAGGDPLAAIAMAPGEPAFYWRSDSRDIEIAALGAVAVVDGGGESRLADAAAQLRALAATIEDEAPDLPLAVGGFAFDAMTESEPWRGFPALRFFVPRALWVRRGSDRTFAVAYAAGRGQTPPALLDSFARLAASRSEEDRGADACEDDGSWKARVAAATDTIARGELEKIVLARRRTFALPPSLRAEALARVLAETRPDCFTFLVRWYGKTFLGSSPERLVSVAGGLASADALAGTAPRGLSRSHDEAQARELLASAKERREHRIVADAVAAALAPLATTVERDAEPRVLALPEAFHLYTGVRASLAAPLRDGLLEAARLLHPTPAVCGAPRAEALRRLAADERERGWYGGAIGWIDGAARGELAVALRAALLAGGRAHVWAGAGIVEGSVPERELDETERKMRAIVPYLEAPSDECAA